MWSERTIKCDPHHDFGGTSIPRPRGWKKYATPGSFLPSCMQTGWNHIRDIIGHGRDALQNISWFHAAELLLYLLDFRRVWLRAEWTIVHECLHTTWWSTNFLTGWATVDIIALVANQMNLEGIHGKIVFFEFMKKLNIKQSFQGCHQARHKILTQVCLWNEMEMTYFCQNTSRLSFACKQPTLTTHFWEMGGACENTLLGICSGVIHELVRQI